MCFLSAAKSHMVAEEDILTALHRMRESRPDDFGNQYILEVYYL
jgi:hypothetical protein